MNRIGNLPVDLYSSAMCDDNTHIHIFTVVACTLNSRLLSGHLGVIAVGDLFSPSAVVRWVFNLRDPVLCARVLLLQNVCQKNLSTTVLQVTGTLQQSSQFFFLFACLRRCLGLSLSNRNKIKPTVTSKKHASRSANLLLCLLQP